MVRASNQRFIYENCIRFNCRFNDLRLRLPTRLRVRLQHTAGDIHMAGPLAASLITGGASLLGGLFGKGPSVRKQLDDQYNHQQRLETNRYQWLVDGAKKAGFNPLTALKATGGVMAPQNPVQQPLTTGQAIGDAITTGVQNYMTHDPVAEERAQLENDLLKRQIQTLDNENQRFGVSPVRRTSSPVDTESQPLAPQDFRRQPHAHGPKERPTVDNKPRIPVYLPGGGSAYLLTEIADRFGLQAWSMLAADDMTGILGEVTGEAHNTLQADQVADRLMRIGIFSDYEDRQKEEAEKQSRDKAKPNQTKRKQAHEKRRRPNG